MYTVKPVYKVFSLIYSVRHLRVLECIHPAPRRKLQVIFIEDNKVKAGTSKKKNKRQIKD